MTLLIISSHFYGMFGGVADYTYHLSKSLVQERIKVFVLTSNDERVKKDDEVNVLPLIDKWNILTVLTIMRTIRGIRPNVVNLQYVPYMYSYYGVPLYMMVLAVTIRIMGFRLMTTFHEVAIRFDWRKPKYWGIAILQRLIAYILALCSNRVILSIEFYQEMLKPFRRKIYRIPVGSNVTPIPVSDEERIRLRTKIVPNGEFLIATFGAGAPWRRTDLLLKAAGEFAKASGRRLKVLLLGRLGDPSSGDYYNLKDLIGKLGMEDTTYITGYLKNEDVYKYLAIADLFVLLDANAYGGVSMRSTALAAAYAASLPIIGNRGALTDDFLKQGQNIYLLDSLEEEDIVRAIERLVIDGGLRQQLVQGSVKTYRDWLTWEKIAQCYCQILRAQSAT